MAVKYRKDALASEVSALNSLLSSLDAGDLIGRMSLEYKRDELEEELKTLSQQVDTLGSVVLAFEGGPVTGSRAIDASFAAKTLDAYQDLIAKQVAAEQDVNLARTGPVPSKSLARLNITSIVHGSFGFELEEAGSDQLSIVESPVRRAISAVDNALQAFGSRNEIVFQEALAGVDRRVFISLQAFFENMYRDSAALKISEPDRDILLDQYDVIQARTRITGVRVEDKTIRLHGRLLGLTPISRRYDLAILQSSDLTPGMILSGQAGERLSNDYLERLMGESRISGQVYEATLNWRKAFRADKTETESFTLLDLEPVSNALTRAT